MDVDPQDAALCGIRRRRAGVCDGAADAPAGRPHVLITRQNGAEPSPAALVRAAETMIAAPGAAAPVCCACARELVLGLCRPAAEGCLDAMVRLAPALDLPWDVELVRAVVRCPDDRLVPLLVRLSTAQRPVALPALTGLAARRGDAGAVPGLVAVLTGSVGDRELHCAATRALVAAGPAAVDARRPVLPGWQGAPATPRAWRPRVVRGPRRCCGL
ncbi:hypothetical protein, partial [Kitasatospora sp. NPDC059571]|uniref:hypothetical protein n=1 Tax=Kitasatospora sp. NPDC059571 TaxID=3346871 RepID=UPI003675E02E